MEVIVGGESNRHRGPGPGKPTNLNQKIFQKGIKDYRPCDLEESTKSFVDWSTVVWFLYNGRLVYRCMVSIYTVDWSTVNLSVYEGFFLYTS